MPPSAPETTPVFAQNRPLAFDLKRLAALREDWREIARAKDAALDAFMENALNDSPWADVLAGVFGASGYLSDLALAAPEVVQAVARDGAGAVVDAVIAALDAGEHTGDFAAAATALRDAKDRAALAIAFADLSAQWTVEQVTAALSDFADACVRLAVRTLLLRAHARGHIALTDLRAPEIASGYTVIGLGKLGGRELNYSSDIDLFVFFDEARLAYTGPKSAPEFAVELTKDLVRLLQERTAGRYVFRTDLRLRPDPGSTSIAVSRTAAQSYYENYGQNWERAVFIKARPVAGDAEAAQGFLRDLQPFIWRKSLDFYAIQDIQSIKRQIYAHKGGGHVTVLGHNIKLGRGGIREIEFFAQIQQLIWGGRFPEARVSQTLAALDILTSLGFVEGTVRDDLTQAYRALRTLEHRLQMIADEQTQTLPKDAAAFARLAAFMGYGDTAVFAAAVERWLRTVETHYAGLFEDAPSLAITGANGSDGGNLVFTGTEDDPDTIATLSRLGYREPQTVAQLVRAWHHGRYRATRSNRARQLLTEVMPALLSAFARTAQPDAALIRFDRSLAALPAGVPLLSVFYSNTPLLDLVAEIMGDAPRLAEHVTRTPTLLDYVLEPQFYGAVGDRAALMRDLEMSLANAATFEDMLDLVRRWTHDQQFRIGVQALRGLIDPLIAAEQLTAVAEATVVNLLPRVENEFAVQYGRVAGNGLAVLAYGKFASRELTPTSDLDLVLIYDGNGDGTSQGGAKTLPAPAYYIRLVQRVVSAFTLLTREGSLYTVDMRLRPSGDKGPLAASLEAFAKYQIEDAWTWEHLALVRSRVVAGEPPLAAAITQAVTTALDKARDPALLICAIADMRALMRKEQADKGLWDIKRHPGGLIDAEFVLHTLVLKHRLGASADSRPQTLIGRLMQIEALSPADGRILGGAIALWSRLQFMIRLTSEDDVPDALPLGLRRTLARIAGLADDSSLDALMTKTAAGVSALFEKIITVPAAAARETLPPGTAIR